MHNWKSKVLRKKTRQSHTPGRTKVLSCRADWLKKTLAKRSRSYKMPEFANWYIIFGKR